MADNSKSIHKTLKQYGRGIAGGLLFSLPMLYTMEMWWAGFISSPLDLIIYLCVGILIYQMIIHEHNSPDMIVKLGEPEAKTNHFAIPVEVKNEGTQTAKDVFIEVFADHAPEGEKGKVHFDYVPGKSSVNGWVIFMNRPDYPNLKAHVMGYEVP